MFISKFKQLTSNVSKDEITLMNKSQGSSFVNCSKILSQYKSFFKNLPSFFQSYKDIFINDYNRFFNCNDLKCDIYKICDLF
jgi:hypothetical protein